MPDLPVPSSEAPLAPLMVAGVPLGPPDRTHQWVIGGVCGAPIGLGLGLSAQSWLIWLGGAGLLTYLMGASVLAIVDFQRCGIEFHAALGAVGRGELAKARDVFTRWAPNRFGWISASARHNLGATLLLEGRLEEAVQILEDAAATYKLSLTHVGLLPTTRLDVALCHALLGNLDLAEAWATRAAEPVTSTPRTSFPGAMALVRGIVACRRGHPGEAMVALEHAWAEHETMLTGETLRMIRVVRAHACAASDGPRNQGLVERVLGDVRPRYAHEFAFLGGAWPDMAAFLETHRLAG